MVAAASAVAAATGLRLCGMVEEPPRPSPAGSKASPTSVCIISETSRAILPQLPARMANTEAASAMRSRWVCQGASGSGSLSSCASRSATGQSLVAERGERAGGAAELQRQRLAAQPPQALRERCRAAAYSASLSPNGIGSACCSQVRATTGVWRCCRASLAKPAIGAVDIGEQRFDRRRAEPSIVAVSIDILAGRAPMHIARGVGVRLGDLRGQRLDQGDREIAGARRGLGQCGEIE